MELLSVISSILSQYNFMLQISAKLTQKSTVLVLLLRKISSQNELLESLYKETEKFHVP